MTWLRTTGNWQSSSCPDIPPMPAGIPKLEIRFQLNADGILQVLAKELRSGTAQSIMVKPQYGIDEEEMGRMLLESIQHAEEDMQVKGLREAQNEARMMVQSAGKFIHQNHGWLDESQVKEIQRLAGLLGQSIEAESKDAIQKSLETLNDYTTPLAHKALEVHVAGAMKGQTIK